MLLLFVFSLNVVFSLLLFLDNPEMITLKYHQCLFMVVSRHSRCYLNLQRRVTSEFNKCYSYPKRTDRCAKNAPFAVKAKHILEVVNLCSLLPKRHFSGNYDIFLPSFGKQRQCSPKCPARTNKASYLNLVRAHVASSVRSGVLQEHKILVSFEFLMSSLNIATMN